MKAEKTHLLPGIDKPRSMHYTTNFNVVPRPPTRVLMQRSPSAREVSITGRVSAEELRELEFILPFAAVKSWLIRKAIHDFNNALDAHPHLAEGIHARIALMTTDGFQLNGKSAELQVKIPVNDYRRFNSHLPEYGATSWFLRQILKNFLHLLKPHKHLLDALRNDALVNLLYEPDK